MPYGGGFVHVVWLAVEWGGDFGLRGWAWVRGRLVCWLETVVVNFQSDHGRDGTHLLPHGV